MKDSQKELYKRIFEIIAVIGFILIAISVNDHNLDLLLGIN